MPEKKKLYGEVRETYNQYKQCIDYWQNFFDRGAESVRFHGGDQWEPEDIAEFQSKKRPVVTINVTSAMVRQVTGLRTRERLHPRVRPEREGTVDMANIKTKLLYFILKRNNYHIINHDVQEDQVVTGRGWWETYMDVEDNPMGDIKIRKADWNEVVPDFMHKDEYCRDSRYMFRARFLPKEVVMDTYDEPGDLPYEQPDTMTWTDDDGPRTKNIHNQFVDGSGNYLVIEKWEIKKKRRTLITDGKIFRTIDGRISEEAAQDVIQGEIVQTDKMEKEVWVTTIIPELSGDELVSKKPAKLQIGEYPFVPAVCYRAGDKISGIVEDLKDEQRRTNKAFSQIIEILGYSAKGLWMVKKGSVDEEQFDNNVTRPGGKLFWEGTTPPQHVETAKLPAGYAQIFEVSERNLQRISGIVPALEGRSEYSGESGIKYAQKLQQAREQLAVIDRRFIDAFNYVCKLILKAIPQVYDYDFAFQVLEGNDQIKDIHINEETIHGVMNDVANDTGEYDINIEQTAESSTLRQAQLQEMSQMFANQPQFAGLIIGEFIRNSDIENKEEIAERVEMLSGQTLQLEQTKMQLAMMQAQQGAQSQNVQDRATASRDAREDALAKAKIEKMGVDNEAKASITQVDNLNKMVEMSRPEPERRGAE